MPTTREEALERLAERARFVALPEILTRLLTMFDDPEVNAAEVSEIIRKDAGLVTRLLRVANSAYYGTTVNVATVQQAIVKLGFRTSKAVVLSSAVYTSLSKSVPADVDLRPFWQHALEVAVAAMLIAEEACPRVSEETFVAGLLHDIGRVAFASAFPEEFRQALADGPEAWDRENERERFGVDHCEAGAHLAQRWNFPAILRTGIDGHHEIPESLPQEPRERVALCVGLADGMARASWAGLGAVRPDCRERREKLSALLNMSRERLNSIDSQVQPQMSEWANLLEIDLGDPLELLEDANRRLFELYRALDEAQADNEQLQNRLLIEEGERAKLEALRVICATFSHHINNATTTILGRAQLVNLAVGNDKEDERSAKIAQSMQAIENAVDAISGVLGELKCLTRFDTVSYHGKSEILDLQNKTRPRPKRKKYETPENAAG